MKICREILISAAALFAGLTTSALAQSSAVVVPGVVAEGTTPAAPVTPLDIQDTDYPLESLLANEEGKIQLNLIVNARGQVTAVRVLTPTKLTRLEQQAANIARIRWQFTPAMRDGEGVAAQVNVDVEWKLPAERVRDYDVSNPVPLEGTTLGRVTFDKPSPEDYPPASLRRQDQAVVAVRYLVQAEGNLGEVQIAQASGVKELDSAAITFVRNRVKAQPAVANGSPVPAWRSAIVAFGLTPTIQDKSKMRCFEKPLTGDSNAFVVGTLVVGSVQIGVPVSALPRELRNLKPGQPIPPELNEKFNEILRKQGQNFGPGPSQPAQPRSGDVPDKWVQRWVHVTRNGAITDALLGTADGFVRLSPAVLAPMQQTKGYVAPKTDAGCWYFDPINIPATR